MSDLEKQMSDMSNNEKGPKGPEKNNKKAEVIVATTSIEEIDPKAEKAVLRRMDLRLMPLFGAMYFFSYLDRSNAGNAKVAGMLVDINMTQSQFSTASSILYAPYILVQIPGVLMMRKFKPNLYLGAMMVCWALVTIFTVFIQNYAGFLVQRVLIGFFEGSFYSCMAVYTASCYDAGEMGTRFGYLFVSSSLSSAFGGLIATGITKIRSGALQNWRYLFLIEGLATLILGVCVVFFLPAEIGDIFTTEEEKKTHELRLQRRKLFSGEKEFDFKKVLEAFTSVKTFTSITIQFCQDICLYGFTTFLPSILLSMGFDSLEAQYLTIPVYLLAGAIFLTLAILSDVFKTRSPIMFCANLFSITGYAIILGVDNNAVKYFGCFLITVSLYTNVGINEAWLATNTAPTDKRSASIAANQAFGNSSGIVAPQVYRAAPYVLGHWFTIGCLIFSNLTIVFQAFLYWRENARRERVLESEILDEEEEMRKGDRSAKFRFMI